MEILGLPNMGESAAHPKEENIQLENGIKSITKRSKGVYRPD